MDKLKVRVLMAVKMSASEVVYSFHVFRLKLFRLPSFIFGDETWTLVMLATAYDRVLLRFSLPTCSEIVTRSDSDTVKLNRDRFCQLLWQFRSKYYED